MNKFKLISIVMTALTIFSSCNSIPDESIPNTTENLQEIETDSTTNNYSEKYKIAYSKAEESLTLEWENMNAISHLLVMEEGEIVYEKGFGYLGENSQETWQADDLTNIGSVSKLFVTTSILILEQENKLNLDDPIISYLPEFKMNDERYKDITIRMLLNHSSGLPGAKYDGSFLYKEDTTKDYYQKLLLDLSDETLKADPGNYPVYCNEGFILAQKIVETESGMNYEDYINDKVLGPMNIDPIYVSANSNIPIDKFVPYIDPTGTLSPREVVIEDFAGTGGLTMDAKTLALFGERILSQENSVLTEESKELFREDQSKYSVLGENNLFNGLGWDYIEYPFGNLPVYSKNGGTMNYLSQIIVAPESKLVVVGFSTNPSSIGTVVENLVLDILIEQGQIKKDIIHVPNPSPSTEIPPEILSKQGKYSIIGGALAFDIGIAENQLVMPFVPLSKIGNETGTIPYVYDGINTFSSPEINGKIEQFSFEEIEGHDFIIRHFVSEYGNYKVVYAQRVESQNSSYNWENLNHTIWLKNDINKNSMMGMQDMISVLAVDSNTTGFVTFVRNTPFRVINEHLANSVNETSRDAGNLILKDEKTLSFRDCDYTIADGVAVFDDKSLGNLVFDREDKAYWFMNDEEQQADLSASLMDIRMVIFDENLMPIFDSVLNPSDILITIPANAYIMVSEK